MLATLLPNRLPTAMSYAPMRSDAIDATSSGREVVTARSAAPRNDCSIPVCSAMALTASVATGALRKMKQTPTPKPNHSLPNEYCAAFSLQPGGLLHRDSVVVQAGARQQRHPTKPGDR